MKSIGILRVGIAGLWLLFIPPAEPVAQSLLSVPPSGWVLEQAVPWEDQEIPDSSLEIVPGDPAAWEETSEGAPSAMAPEPELSELLDMVDEGLGREAYLLLAARLEPELEKARARGEDVSELKRKLLIYLLRSGEGYAAPEAQETVARRFTEEFPDDDSFPLAYFYLNHALYLQGKRLEESFLFDEDALEELPAWMQSRYLIMKAERTARRDDYLAAAGFLLAEQNSGSTLQESTPQEVEALLEQMVDQESLEEFLQTHDDVEWLEEKRLFLQVRVMVNRGEIAAALLEINRITNEGLATTPSQIKSVHAIRAEITSRILTASGAIGVLLPLGSSSSSLRALASQALDGLRLALLAGREPREGHGASLAKRLALDFQPLQETAAGPPKPLTPNFELIVRDTGNNPARAAELVEELVREEHVIAIIGPIARRESAAAAERAEALEVPIISFSLTMEIPLGARNVFRHSKSQEEEVRDIVSYAMDYRDARRFVILYPSGGYGEHISGLFWDEVTRRGGRVVGVESYRPARGRRAREEVGLKEIFERFTGLDRPQDAIDIALQEAVDDSKPDPIVDFDAIYIPIGPAGGQDLRLIAPYPVTVDAERVLLLGSRFWNSDEVIVAGADKLEGAVFVDAYDRKSMVGGLRAFRRRHRVMFGHRANYREPSYYTAFAYDTLNILAKLLRERVSRNRKVLARALTSMEPYSGVTGLTSFLETGEAVKESMFFRISGETIRREVP
ncbi:MAG: penicillin-binding protein activator [SAR324 cluster bacterium]|nr:penicillin-binding protein activator [SAR324 cluster bacterium]